MKHLAYIVFFLSIYTGLLMAEASVYANGQGNFVSPSKAIMHNKKSIGVLRQKIAQQNEQIEGLKSIVEGLSATVNELQQNGYNVTAKNNTGNNDALLKELGEMIDKINNEYVSKIELQKILSGQKIDTSSHVTSQRVKKTMNEEAPSTSMENKTSATLYSEGVRLFVKQRFSDAKTKFVATDTQGYKPAESNYYLGEIAYYTKQYDDAVFYFKKSAGLNDQASYIDTLLLHTAISLEKNGEKDQAKTFYENIIANYSDKKSAKIAKQKLKHL